MYISCVYDFFVGAGAQSKFIVIINDFWSDCHSVDMLDNRKRTKYIYIHSIYRLYGYILHAFDHLTFRLNGNHPTYALSKLLSIEGFADFLFLPLIG